jgi:hypothetical protein
MKQARQGGCSQVSRQRELVIGIGEEKENLLTTHPNKAKPDLCRWPHKTICTKIDQFKYRILGLD